MDPNAERQRYTLHDNSLANTGYKRYLERFLDSVLSFRAILQAGYDSSWTFFDYGSGPEPALISMLQARGLTARGWDPLFLLGTEAYPHGADIVTCLEVVEHFKDPPGDFFKLASHARTGGYVAVGTHLIDDLIPAAISPNTASHMSDQSLEDAFLAWWYRQDPTHIAFYSRKALESVAMRAGLSLLGSADTGVFIFRKEAAR